MNGVFVENIVQDSSHTGELPCADVQTLDRRDEQFCGLHQRDVWLNSVTMKKGMGWFEGRKSGEAQNRVVVALMVLLMFCCLNGCSIKRMAVKNVGDAIAKKRRSHIFQ